ncbi:HNH endonuclease [Sorangium sp. So ce145]
MEERTKSRGRKTRAAERSLDSNSSEGAAPAPAKKQTGQVETVGELLYWSYACLAAACAAAEAGLTRYDTRCWMIRAKLFKGLRAGTMKVGSLFADVRDMPSDRCVYCGATPPPKLHGDHLIPRHRGGLESGDNLVWACRSCNSSKNARDLLEWYASKEKFPPLLLLRRYLKLAMAEAEARQIMGAKLVDRPLVTFSIERVPVKYPQPSEFGPPFETGVM